MGYSQRAHTWYGWVIDLTPEIAEWQEEIDYIGVPGFLSLDLDGKQCVFGVELFQSSDVRWEVLSGFESFTAEEAEVQLETWKSEIPDEVKKFVDAFEAEPRFYTFCTFL